MPGDLTYVVFAPSGGEAIEVAIKTARHATKRRKIVSIAKGYHGTMIPEIWRGHQRGGEGFLIALNRLADAYFKAMEK